MVRSLFCLFKPHLYQEQSPANLLHLPYIASGDVGVCVLHVEVAVEKAPASLILSVVKTCLVWTPIFRSAKTSSHIPERSLPTDTVKRPRRRWLISSLSLESHWTEVFSKQGLANRSASRTSEPANRKFNEPALGKEIMIHFSRLNLCLCWKPCFGAAVRALSLGSGLAPTCMLHGGALAHRRGVNYKD